MRRLAAIVLTLLLAGCAAETPVKTPAMYVNLAEPGATLDPEAAASMISQYRQKNGLGGVTVDPALMRLAEAQARAMASANRLDRHVRVPLVKRLSHAGYPTALAVENVSAGDYTLAMVCAANDDPAVADTLTFSAAKAATITANQTTTVDFP